MKLLSVIWLRILLLVISLSCSILTGRAQTSFQLTDSIPQWIFTYDYIEYLEDPSHNLTYADVKSERYQHKFRVSVDFTPDNYHLSSTYWLRIKLRNNTSSRNNWLLEFFDQTIDEITAYIPHASGMVDTVRFGDLSPFNVRRIKHKNFLIPLQNDHNSELTYYFRIRSNHPVDLILVLRSYDYFTFYSLNEYFLFGLFYGLIILIALYNLLFFFAIREIQYLYFVLYALSIVLYFSSVDGFAYQYVWPKHPQWNQVAYGVFIYLSVLFASLFTIQFLHLKYKSPLLNRVLIYFIIARTLFFLFCLIWKPVWFDYHLLDVIPLTLLFGTGVLFLQQGYQPARLFILSFGFLMVGVLIKILIAIGIGNYVSSAAAYYSLNITFFLQLITLSFALGDKVRILKNKKDRALKRIVKEHEINARLQTKVNRELEEKVKQRTHEIKDQNEALEVANLLLKRQSQEIQQMNQLLDKDLWKIKKTSKKKQQHHLLTSHVTYAEFMTFFPDQFSCYTYLYELKWKKRYVCKKCGHIKCHEFKFVKRCSTCGYEESVTAHTVFHKLKFPIQKAFYIAHLQLSHTKMTTKEMAAVLCLRPSTCARFRKKIDAALSDWQKQPGPLDFELLLYSHLDT